MIGKRRGIALVVKASNLRKRLQRRKKNERICRTHYPEAARCWEGSLEFDFVREEKPGRLIVTEAKWRRLSGADKARAEQRLRQNWQKSALARKYPAAGFQVPDATALGSGFS
jgi:hypothetical protein